MIIADLSRPELDRCLQATGLRLRIGPVVANIRSALPSVASGISTHYARHVVESADGFADFHVNVQRARAARPWRAAEVTFLVDGIEPIGRLPGDDGFPMLEWGLQWCVSAYCHQYLIICGAALERHGRALLLPGTEGCGKSTLAAGLSLTCGWRLLSDAVILVDPDTGRVVAFPRPVGMDEESMKMVRDLEPGAAFVVSEHTLPRTRITFLRPNALDLGDEQSVSPAWVVFASCEPSGAAQIRPLDGALAFMSMIECSVNYNLHGRRGFGTLAKVIDASTSLQCTHSTLPEAMTMLGSLAVGARFDRP